MCRLLRLRAERPPNKNTASCNYSSVERFKITVRTLLMPVVVVFSNFQQAAVLRYGPCGQISSNLQSIFSARPPKPNHKDIKHHFNSLLYKGSNISLSINGKIKHHINSLLHKDRNILLSINGSIDPLKGIRSTYSPFHQISFTQQYRFRMRTRLIMKTNIISLFARALTRMAT